MIGVDVRPEPRGSPGPLIRNERKPRRPAWARFVEAAVPVGDRFAAARRARSRR
jgi:hypothetical protein